MLASNSASTLIHQVEFFCCFGSQCLLLIDVCRPHCTKTINVSNTQQFFFSDTFALVSYQYIFTSKGENFRREGGRTPFLIEMIKLDYKTVGCNDGSP